MITIYALVDPFSGDVRYVGKTIHLQKRMRDHLRIENLIKKTYLAHWITSLLGKGVKPKYKILEIAGEDRWEGAERKWISFYRDSSGNLCNHTDGGEGTAGFHPSDETRKKMSESMRARHANPEYKIKRNEALRRAWIDPTRKAKRIEAMCGGKRTVETRKKMSEARIGKKHTAETLAKMGDAHRGKKLSEEHKAKLREALRGRVFTDEHRAKISEAKRLRDQKSRDSAACG